MNIDWEVCSCTFTTYTVSDTSGDSTRCPRCHKLLHLITTYHGDTALVSQDMWDDMAERVERQRDFEKHKAVATQSRHMKRILPKFAFGRKV